MQKFNFNIKKSLKSLICHSFLINHTDDILCFDLTLFIVYYINKEWIKLKFVRKLIYILKLAYFKLSM